MRERKKGGWNESDGRARFSEYYDRNNEFRSLNQIGLYISCVRHTCISMSGLTMSLPTNKKAHTHTHAVWARLMENIRWPKTFCTKWIKVEMYFTETKELKQKAHKLSHTQMVVNQRQSNFRLMYFMRQIQTEKVMLIYSLCAPRHICQKPKKWIRENWEAEAISIATFREHLKR